MKINWHESLQKKKVKATFGYIKNEFFEEKKYFPH